MAKSGSLSKLQIPEFIFKDNASCAETDPELFFSHEVLDFNGKVRGKYLNLAAAKKICDSCPLKIDCLEYALNNNEVGIWGGTTEEQRSTIRRSSNRKVIRKSASPELW